MTTTRPADPPPTEDPTAPPLAEHEPLAGVVARAGTAPRHRLGAATAHAEHVSPADGMST